MCLVQHSTLTYVEAFFFFGSVRGFFRCWAVCVGNGGRGGGWQAEIVEGLGVELSVVPAKVEGAAWRGSLRALGMCHTFSSGLCFVCLVCTEKERPRGGSKDRGCVGPRSGWGVF